ncbi:hypothetical protein GCM10011514_40930 [Emticicia aquatilis]|uniref:Uncharacterized protein n=1 Tax=Emticicia aquatilis TaxID=1537369 RepID=A0A916Z3E7_9BACT|nr:hypothetical protein [Emticicia aquatilis]GGD72639.1 hypothetical protein GCM10011514_40930 [Emticicia aquatilis]
MNRYSVQFKDGREYTLYGSDYFNDKAVFYRHHYSNLIAFSVVVAENGYPISIKDNESKELLNFDKMESFKLWFEKNQAKGIDFGFSELDDLKKIENECYIRVNKIISFILQEIKELQSEQKFDTWRIDGGYKVLKMICNVSIVSINSFESRTNLSSNKLTIFKRIFDTPKELVDYSQTADKIKPEKLIRMCKSDLNSILNLKKSLEPIKRWWEIWK